MSGTSSLPIEGYFLVPAPAGGHVLCGHQSIPGAVSPNSGKPLLQLALIRTTDPRLGLQPAPFEALPLLYGWTCDIHRDVFSYRVDAGKIEIVRYQQGRSYSDFPYQDYPEAFPPRSMDLVPTSVKVPRPRGVDPDQPRHQLGGSPRLMQDLLSLQCPSCSRDMPLFAAIADDNGTPQGFTGNPYVQVVFHLCDQCWMVSCYNMCD